MGQPHTGLQLRSLVRATGELELSLVDAALPEPGSGEIVVRIAATPINPSDIGLLFGAADMDTATFSGTRSRPVVTARVPERAMKSMAPPGASGTMKWIGLLGQPASCARTKGAPRMPPLKAVAAAAAFLIKVRRPILRISRPQGFRFVAQL